MKCIHIARASAAVLCTLAVIACGGDSTAPAAECGDPPYLSALPAASADINFTSTHSGYGAPGHTLPTPHVGIFMKHVNVPIYSPGKVEVVQLRRTTYVTSPRRQGKSDYTIEFRLCRDIQGWYGHVTTLTDAFPSDPGWRDCQTYSTSDETVQSCFARPAGVTLTAGQQVGTAAMSAELGLMALDFGLLDNRVNHTFISPWRFPQPLFHAVCPYEYFDTANRDVLIGLMRDAFSPAPLTPATPPCGTMQVDVPNTAQGIWVETGVTTPVGGNETQYITLANDPYRPQTRLSLSLGPTILGATVGIVGRETSGRVNRVFSDVTADGLIYCYTSVTPSVRSWFLALPTSTTLSIRRIDHAAGASPCLADPGTWSFGSNTLSMVR